jgi:hypothetical protein
VPSPAKVVAREGEVRCVVSTTLGRWHFSVGELGDADAAPQYPELP